MKFTSGHYLAFELSERSRERVLAMFPPKFSKVLCHHVTIEFNLTEQNFQERLELTGDDPKIITYGYAAGDGIECLAVTMDGHLARPDDSFFHLTLSVEPPHQPVESNELGGKLVSITNVLRAGGNCSWLLEGKLNLLRR